MFYEVKNDRIVNIYNYFKDNPLLRLSVRELYFKYNVGRSTMLCDLNLLEKLGLIKLVSNNFGTFKKDKVYMFNEGFGK